MTSSSNLPRWYFFIISLFVVIYHNIMDRPKRPPPVPKFEEKNDKAELEKKLNSFISSITTSSSAESKPELPKV